MKKIGDQGNPIDIDTAPNVSTVGTAANHNNQDDSISILVIKVILYIQRQQRTF